MPFKEEGRSVVQSRNQLRFSILGLELNSGPRANILVNLSLVAPHFKEEILTFQIPDKIDLYAAQRHL